MPTRMTPSPRWSVPRQPSELPVKSTAELLHLHYDHLRAARDECVGSGYLVTALRADSELVGVAAVTFGWVDAQHTLVVGSHPHADLRLGGDEGVSDLHLVVRIDSKGRRPRLRVIDLATPMGFAIDDGSARRGLSTERVASVRLGDYTLLFVPLWRELDAWPDTAVELIELIGPTEWVQAPAGCSCGAGDWLLEGAIPLPELAADGTNETAATLNVQTPDGEQTFPLDADALARGVIVGEPPSGDGEGRYLLLVAHGAEVVMVDLAAKSGILVHRLDRRAVSLPTRCTIELDAGQTARWQLIGGPDARSAEACA